MWTHFASTATRLQARNDATGQQQIGVGNRPKTAGSARTSPLWREYRRVPSRWNEVVGGCCCFVSLFFFFFGCFPALPLGANVKRLSVSNLFLWRAISERSVGTKWTEQCGVSVYGFYVVHFVGPNFYRYRATGLCGSDKSEEMIMTDQGFFLGGKRFGKLVRRRRDTGRQGNNSGAR